MDPPTDVPHTITTESREALDRVLTAARSAARPERQHVEIVALVLVGDVARARALRAAHLAEFPDDVLIVHVFDLVESRSPSR
jgi:DNA-binding GntR family transcriptional regulator